MVQFLTFMYQKYFIFTRNSVLPAPKKVIKEKEIIMRSKNAILNISTSLILQMLTAISGLVISRLILLTYGSGVNGLVASISQFLSYVSLLEAGVGGVIRAALFKPLAEKNIEKVSEIVKATKLFFQKIAYIFSFYVILLAIAYPYVVRGSFSWGYVFSLVIIISVSTLFEYFFCLPYINLLSADQKVWVISLLNSVLVIMNIIVIYIAIILGMGIHGVKICGIFVYAIKPIFYYAYVKKYYKLQKTKVVYHIEQKWNGLVHNLAQFIHNNTDVALITLFINVSEVSVYAVYYAVASGIERVISSISVGCAAGIGDVIARNEKERLNEVVNTFEFIQSGVATVLFTVTGVMIVPFVKLYSQGVTDTNYLRPIFSYLLVLAELFYCIRSIYSTIILNAGHYKQTQINAVMEAVTNILISLILIQKMGITGVAIGTLAGMFVRTIMDVHYLSKNIVYRSPKYFLKSLIINTVVFVISSFVGHFIPITVVGWMSWLFLAFIVFISTSLFAILVYRIAYSDQMHAVINRIKLLIVR